MSQRFRLQLLAAISLLLTFVSGCSYAGHAADPPAQLTIQELELGDAVTAWRNKSALFVDVRSAQEFKDGHIPGARLLPLPLLENNFADLPKDRPLILVCRSARRSAQANLLLQQLGFSNTASMKGGIELWPEAQEKD